ncbi:uncharacterized [Tachysurus ichikawai]
MWSCLLELQPRDTLLKFLHLSLRHESRPLAFVSAPLAPLVFTRHGNQHAHRVRDPSVTGPVPCVHSDGAGALCHSLLLLTQRSRGTKPPAMVATVPLSRFLMINDREKCARGRVAVLKRSQSVKRNLYKAIKPHVDELLVQK